MTVRELVRDLLLQDMDRQVFVSGTISITNDNLNVTGMYRSNDNILLF